MDEKELKTCTNCNKQIDFEKVNTDRHFIRYYVAFGYCPECTEKKSNYYKNKKKVKVM